MPNVWIVCTACGSHDVRCDAYAAWNADAQQWEISSLFDNTDCEDCGGECSVIECPTAQGIDPGGYTIEKDDDGTWSLASGETTLLAGLSTRAHALQAAIDRAAKAPA